jgi:carbonic anhydrase
MIRTNAKDAPAGAYKESAASWADGITFLPFNRTGREKDDREVVENSVRQDVAFLRSHLLIKPSVLITGWYYNLSTGLVEVVTDI